MTNNDCLRRIRYILDFDDSTMVSIFSLLNHQISREQLCALLKKDEDPDFEPCSDLLLSTFLNGLIIEMRGETEDGPPQPENSLNNNIIFRKLRIAFDLKAEEILSLLSRANCQISKHELSAFFRKPGNRQYRECKDQVLRNFLAGLQLKYRKGKGITDSSDKGEKEPAEVIWGKKPGKGS